MLDRELHRRGLFPPIDVLPSLSRLMNAGIGEGKTRAEHREWSDQLYAVYARGREARADGSDPRRIRSSVRRPARPGVRRAVRAGVHRAGQDAALDLPRRWRQDGACSRACRARTSADSAKPRTSDAGHRPATVEAALVITRHALRPTRINLLRGSPPAGPGESRRHAGQAEAGCARARAVPPRATRRCRRAPKSPRSSPMPGKRCSRRSPCMAERACERLRGRRDRSRWRSSRRRSGAFPSTDMVGRVPLQRMIDARGVSPATTGPATTEAARRFEMLAERLLEVAAAEQRLRRISEAVAEESRHLRTLEQRVAPALDGADRRR